MKFILVVFLFAVVMTGCTGCCDRYPYQSHRVRDEVRDNVRREMERARYEVRRARDDVRRSMEEARDEWRRSRDEWRRDRDWSH